MFTPALIDPPLSRVLRDRTAPAHADAEHSPFFAALAGGRVTGLGVAALLVRLAPVYAALEHATADARVDPVLRPFLIPGLERSGRIASDLRYLTDGTVGALSPAARAYADRISEVRGSAPRFLAHHYTRYLGDLSGGQVIRSVLARSLGLADSEGLSFFTFPALRPGAVKAAYRRRLDALPFDEVERDQLVEEAVVAYRLNVALSAELDADLPRWTTA